MKKIIVCGGGTGGHFFPTLAAGEEIKNRGYDVHIITDQRCEKYLKSNQFLTSHIIKIKVNNQNFISKIISFFSIFLATLKALILFIKLKPAAVIGFGGYPVFPSLAASIILRIPIIIHEQNCFLGKTNKFFLRFAAVIVLAYKDTLIPANILKHIRQKIIISGNIVRENIRKLPVKQHFNSSSFNLLILGGSQGAKVFFTLIPEAIKILVKQDISLKLKVTQQASLSDHQTIGEIYSSLDIPYQLSDFFHNIYQHYEEASLVIARSGASTIAELTTIGLPAIFIPYPYDKDYHQFYNAKSLEKANAGWCLEQKNLTSQMLADKILYLIQNPSLLQQASENLLKMKTNGAYILADTVEKIIN